MKRLIKALLMIVIAVVFVMPTVGCGENGGESDAPGLHYKKLNNKDYYTVYKYVPELDENGEEKTVLNIGEYNKDGVIIGRIKEGAFSGNATLKEIIVPETVEQIDAGAFKEMKYLEKITLPFVGANRNADAFDKETANAENKAVDSMRNFAYIFGTEKYDNGAPVKQKYSIIESATETTYYIPATLTEVNINASQEYSIPMFAFYGLTNINTVNLSGNIKAIGKYAFAEFTTLTKTNVPASVKNVYDNAYECCEKLATFTNDATEVEYGENVFNNCPMK